MIKLYGVVFSNNVNKVRYCLDYLKLPYEVVPVNPMLGEQKTPEYLDLCPTAKIPALDDNGFKIFESTSIIRYLAEKQNSPIYPENPEARAIVNAWMDYSSIHIGQAMSRILFNRVIAPMINREVDEKSLQFGIEMVNQYLPIIDQQLKSKKFIAGNEFSIADINLFAVLDPCELCQIDLTPYKSITSWRNDLKKQDFTQTATKEKDAFIQSMMARK